MAIMAVNNNTQVLNTALNYDSDDFKALVKGTCAKGASDEQLISFLMLAKSYNLNPFNKEIYFAGSFIMVGRHGKLRIANRHPDFGGLKSCEIRENDDFEFDAVKQEVIKHTLKGKNGKIIGAWATCYRKGFNPVTVICWADEYKKNNNAWNGYLQDMIKYKAEDRALRMQFNSAFEGLNLSEPEEEFIKDNRATFEEAYSPAPKLITTDDILEDDTHEYISEAQLKRFFARAGELKLSKSEVKQMLISNGFIVESSKEINKNDYEKAYNELENLVKKDMLN